MGSCFGKNSNTQQIKEAKQENKIQEIDTLKAKLKITRDKVQNLKSQYENQCSSIDQEIELQKKNGLKNKKKALYLLKQKKQIEELLQNLRVRQQTISKTLNNLQQQNLDKEMIDVLEQSNKYMNQVQKLMDAKNWRQVIQQAKMNQNQEDIFGVVEEDPEVDKLFAQLQKQVTVDKINNMKNDKNNNKVIEIKHQDHKQIDNRKVMMN